MSFKLLELIGIRPKEPQQESEIQETEAGGSVMTVEEEAREIWERCFGSVPTRKGNTIQEE